MMKYYFIVFALCLLASPLSFAQSALSNGGSVSGTLATENEVDVYTFSAQSGDSVQIRTVDANAGAIFVAIQITAPDGSVLATVSNENVAVFLCDGSNGCDIDQTGIYTLTVSSARPTATGPYDIYYTNVNGPLTDGELINGGVVTGQIDFGDIDAYTFDAQAGDSVQIRVADLEQGSLFLAARLYNPDGSLLAANSAESVTLLLCDGSSTCALNQNGTYTLIVDDARLVFTGEYNVYFTNVNGALTEGELVNGGVVTSQIDLGDIDAYTFDAQAGDSVQIRVADLEQGSLFLAARLYNPDGSLLAANTAENVTLLLCDGSSTCALDQSGTYTLIVDDARLVFTGDYNVYFTNVNGALTDGELVNGGVVTGQIDFGDIDAYTFDAQAGDSVQIRVADLELGSLFLAARLYNPDGSLLASNAAESVTALSCNDIASCSLEQNGSYTLVIDDGRISFTGEFNVHFVKVPGVAFDDTLESGELLYGTLELGDLDSYEIFASIGDIIELRVTDTGIGSSLFPVATLYDPDGKLIASASGETVTLLSCGTGSSCTVDQTGTYTLMVSDGRLAFTGSYVVERDVLQSACVQSNDTDGDLVADACDNCLLISNPNQIDADADGAGNACDADINQDCIVNFIDLVALRDVFLSDDAIGDLNTDGAVNFLDISILGDAFLSQPGPSGVPYCGS